MTIAAAASVAAAIKPLTGNVIVQDIEVHGTDQGVSNCFSGVRFNSDGTMDQITDNTGSTYTLLGLDDTGYHDNSDTSTGGEVNHTGEWWTGGPTAGIGDQYEISMVIDSGLVDGVNDLSPDNTWVDLGTSPEIAVTRTGGKDGQGIGSDEAQCTVKIRDASTLTVVATFNVRMISHRLT